MELPEIPGYEPVRPLGRNGAIIYLARRSGSGELVVLKVYDPRLGELHRRHDSLLARLDHPNILRVFEIGDSQGRSYCALEHVDGILSDRLRHAPLSRSQAIRVVRAITLALQYAWRQGMIPLDLTPKSILLTAENVPRLTSFVAMDAVTRLPLGFSEFMAPEEVKGMVPGVDLMPAALVYRVGGVMYAVLTGRPPFAAGDRIMDTVRKVLDESPSAATSG